MIHYLAYEDLHEEILIHQQQRIRQILLKAAGLVKQEQNPRTGLWRRDGISRFIASLGLKVVALIFRKVFLITAQKNR